MTSVWKKSSSLNSSDSLCLGAPAGVWHAGSASENGCYVKLTRTKERVTAAGGPLVLAIPSM
jgi:hypothetical protein